MTKTMKKKKLHEMTNEEWIKSLCTEELTELLWVVKHDAQSVWGDKTIMEWLKEKHGGE